MYRNCLIKGGLEVPVPRGLSHLCRCFTPFNKKKTENKRGCQLIESPPCPRPPSPRAVVTPRDSQPVSQPASGPWRGATPQLKGAWEAGRRGSIVLSCFTYRCQATRHISHHCFVFFKVGHATRALRMRVLPPLPPPLPALSGWQPRAPRRRSNPRRFDGSRFWLTVLVDGSNKKPGIKVDARSRVSMATRSRCCRTGVESGPPTRLAPPPPPPPPLSAGAARPHRCFTLRQNPTHYSLSVLKKTPYLSSLCPQSVLSVFRENVTNQCTF